MRSCPVRTSLPPPERWSSSTNAVDPSTGTIKLRAQFKNSEKRAVAGQFVNIRITLYDQKDALVVPSRSVQTGPSGQYVFVVKPDMTTELRQGHGRAHRGRQRRHRERSGKKASRS